MKSEINESQWNIDDINLGHKETNSYNDYNRGSSFNKTADERSAAGAKF